MPRAHDCRDAGGRAMQEQLPRNAHDCRDAGGRATQEQLPRSGVSQVGTVYEDEHKKSGAGERHRP